MSDHVSLRIARRPRNGERLWCDEPDWPTRLEALSLTNREAENVASFAENGFLVVRNAVSHKQCDRAIDEYESLLERNAHFANYARSFRRLPNIHEHSAAALAVFTSALEVLRYQDILFGYRASIYTSLYFKCGTEQTIHRDVPVFRTAPENFYFGVWFALEDALPENGNLVIMRGGHKAALVDQYELAERNSNDVDSIAATDSPLWSIYQQAVVRECEKLGIREEGVALNKGDALIWHPMLPHGGGKILGAGRTRHSIVYHTVPEGCPVYQMDVFFNRAKIDVPDVAPWSYAMSDGRLYAIR